MLRTVCALSVLRTWRCPFPTLKDGATHFTGTMVCPQAPRRETEGRKGVNSMRISHVDISQPFPVSALPACCSRDALVSSGCGQGGDMPPALLSPSLPLLVTVSWDLWALPCPRDRRDVWGLRPPGMVGSVCPTSQHVQKTGTSLSWPRVWGFGYSFWRMKPCRG